MPGNFRILSLNLDGCSDIAFACQYISAVHPDLVTLQNTTDLFTSLSSADLRERLNASSINSGSSHSLAVISFTFPLKHIQEYDLGSGSYCMVADISARAERFLLFNLKLRGNFFNRPAQISKLLGSDLLSRYDMLLPTVVSGDFFDTLWISGHPGFQKSLQRIAPPFIRATYPARFPLLSRDRFYRSGGIRVEQVSIDNNHDIRRNFKHLPLILDMQVMQSGTSIRTEIDETGKMKQVFSS